MTTGNRITNLISLTLYDCDCHAQVPMDVMLALQQLRVPNRNRVYPNHHEFEFHFDLFELRDAIDWVDRVAEAVVAEVLELNENESKTKMKDFIQI